MPNWATRARVRPDAVREFSSRTVTDDANSQDGRFEKEGGGSTSKAVAGGRTHQSSQLSPSDFFPAGHWVQTALRSKEIVPAAQSLHDDAPVAFWYFPAVQISQWELPPSAAVPLGHTSHEELPVDEAYFPEGQSSQSHSLIPPGTARYFPVEQAMHAALEL